MKTYYELKHLSHLDKYLPLGNNKGVLELMKTYFEFETRRPP